MMEQTPSNDHDLLIKLHTRFESFEIMSSRMWDSVNEKLSRFLVEIANKADKQEVRTLEAQIREINTRLEKIEHGVSIAAAKKETIINLGHIGAKTWAVITGIILFVITLIQALKN